MIKGEIWLINRLKMEKKKFILISYLTSILLIIGLAENLVFEINLPSNLTLFATVIYTFCN